MHRSLIAAATSLALIGSSLLPTTAAASDRPAPPPNIHIEPAKPYFRPYQAPEKLWNAEIGAGEIIAGVITLGILAAILDDNNNDDHVRHYPTRPAQTWPRYTRPDYTYRPPVQHHKPQVKHPRRVMPSSCLRTLHRKGGRNMNIYSQHCLTKQMRHVNNLPRDCYVKFRTNKGVRSGYGRKCLAHHGYRVSKR